MTIWTIGHSTLAIEVFVAGLHDAGIATLADVRSYPGSRRCPQFGREALAASLPAEGIEYVHLPALGGRRRPRPGSRNTAWRNGSFRAYADYMETDAFRAGIAMLLAIASAAPTAIMCAEALWWRCHRGLIADWLEAAGHEVIHLAPPHAPTRHPYTSAARIVDGRLDYTGE